MKKKLKGNKKNEVEKRRAILAEVLEKYTNKNLVPNENAIIKSMRRRGYPDYNRNKLFYDRTILNTQSDYIKYFLPNYSAYQENINKLLQFVAEQSILQYNKTYTQSRKIFKQVLDKEGDTVDLTDEVITSELAQPKGMFLNTLLKAAELMQKHADGQNVQIGALVLQQEFENQRKIIEKYESENSTKLSVVNADQK